MNHQPSSAEAGDPLDVILAAALGMDTTLPPTAAGMSSTLDLSPPVLRDPYAEPGRSGDTPKPLGLTMTGRYQIFGELGRGGMGAVLKGRDPALGRELAIKVLLEQHQERREMVRRFIEEAQVGAQLQHPGIVPVYEVGRLTDRRPYFTMKLVQGRTLAALLADRASGAASEESQPPDLPRFLKIFEQVCQTLAYAHARGVIHRDLKPANVMVGFFSEVQVMDWGLAKVVGTPERAPITPDDKEGAPTPPPSHPITQQGAVIGTPAYMAPEQARGEVDQLDERCDVFGLGGILCEILTGNPPYVGGSTAELRRQAAEANLVDAYARLDASGADADLIQLAKTCLAKDRAIRPRDAGVVAEQVSAYLASVQERLRAAELARAAAQAKATEERKTRRRTQAMAAAIVLFLAGAGTAIWHATANVRLAEEKEKTEDALQGAETQRALVAQANERLTQEKRNTEDALDEATTQHRLAEGYRRQAERLSTLLALEQGLTLCEQGDASQGLLWLARSLQIAPEHAADLQQLIRANLTAWSQVNAITALLPAGPVTFSPDGKVILSGSRDGTAQLWDAATGKPIGTPWKHQGPVRAVAFSPNGQTALTASAKTVQLWETASGKPGGPHLQHEEAVSVVAFHPNRKTIMTAAGKTVRFWDEATGKVIDPPLVHPEWVWALNLSPDGGTLVTRCGRGAGAGLGEARLWEVATGKPLAKLFTQEPVHTMVFSPDSKTVLAAGRDNVARLWEAATGKPIGEPLKHEGVVNGVAFSPDGRTVLTGSADGTARLWEATTGKPLGLPLHHPTTVRAVAFSPDGRTILTCSDRGARLWDAATGRPLGRPLMHDDLWRAGVLSPDGKAILTWNRDMTFLLELARGPAFGPPLEHSVQPPPRPSPFGGVMAGAFSPDGKTLLTGAGPGARLWETPSGKPIGDMLPHQFGVYKLAFSSDNRIALTGEIGGTVRMWDVATGELLGPLLQHPGALYALAFSPDNRLVLTGGSNGARLWEADTGRLLFPLDQKVTVYAAVFSPDGRTLLTGSGGPGSGGAQRWDTATGKPIGPPLHQSTGAVYSVAFSPDGKMMVTGSSNRTAQVWEVATGKPLGPPLAVEALVFFVAFSPDGKKALAGGKPWKQGMGGAFTLQPFLHMVAFSRDGKTILTTSEMTARLWEVATGKPIGEPLHHQRASRGRQDDEPLRLVGGVSQRGEARLWDAVTGKPLGPPLPHQGRVIATAFSPDGLVAMTGSDDKTARLWQVPRPVQGEVERIVLWTQVITGIELDSEGLVSTLDAKTWEQRRQRLEDLGGPPRP